MLVQESFIILGPLRVDPNGNSTKEAHNPLQPVVILHLWQRAAARLLNQVIGLPENHNEAHYDGPGCDLVAFPGEAAASDAEACISVYVIVPASIGPIKGKSKVAHYL